jgi:CspA family cold shock protein
MATGKVRFYNPRKRYGFIVDDETKEDVFFHISGLADIIKENDEVTFDIEIDSDRKRPKAVNIEKK